MKKWFSIALLAIVVTGFVGIVNCDGFINPPTNVNITVVDDQDGNPGGGIHVTWSAPADGSTPDEYVVSVDGVDQVAVTTLEDFVYTPGAKIVVKAIYGSDESAADAEELGAIETPSLNVWTVNDVDPNHPSGFGFQTSGTAMAYAVSVPANAPEIDFYLASGPNLAAPKDHLPTAINEKGSASSSESGTYETLDITAATGVGAYLTNRSLAANGLYGIWLDDTDDGYTADDHFGKALVSGISGEQVTFKLAYQLEPGLRWVLVD